MDIQAEIIFEDEAILAINKPAGLRTIVDGYDPSLPHLVGLLRALYPGILTVHRLDKDTSGVVLFAKIPSAHQHLNHQFLSRETKKEYHALVVGVPEWQHKVISLPLKVNGDRSHRTIIAEKNGKPAITEIAVRQVYRLYTWVSALPKTGYTHQIRAHLAAVGLPILQDPLYKSRLPETQAQKEALMIHSTLPIRRTALHSYQITFIHPITQETTTITAPDPDDFTETIRFLTENS